VKLVSKPFEEFKNDYGAEWLKKPASVRRVNSVRLQSLLRRTFTGKAYTGCHSTLCYAPGVSPRFGIAPSLYYLPTASIYSMVIHQPSLAYRGYYHIF